MDGRYGGREVIVGFDGGDGVRERRWGRQKCTGFGRGIEGFCRDDVGDFWVRIEIGDVDKFEICFFYVN